MWLAKPLHSLSSAEKSSWCALIETMRHRGCDTPLAQSLAWGEAIAAVAGRVYLVFSAEENVGGLVFTRTGTNSAASEVHFECINGPLLDWENAADVKRQLATFVTAVTRLTPNFASLTLRPRWLKENIEKRLAILPISTRAVSHATTLKLDLQTLPPYTPRLRRTLSASTRAGIKAHWQELDSGSLVEFALAAQGFGRGRGFTVPPILWFRALTAVAHPQELLRFGIVTANTPGHEAGCQILIARYGNEAHYLFGHQWRTGSLRAILSPSAVAHDTAIQHAIATGMHSYDLNGDLENPAPHHPYAGVAAFKAQFGATRIHYAVPELRIER